MNLVQEDLLQRIRSEIMALDMTEEEKRELVEGLQINRSNGTMTISLAQGEVPLPVAMAAQRDTRTIIAKRLKKELLKEMGKVFG
jgi:hypothetical protein